jgi:hypothetical protein
MPASAPETITIPWTAKNTGTPPRIFPTPAVEADYVHVQREQGEPSSSVNPDGSVEWTVEGRDVYERRGASAEGYNFRLLERVDVEIAGADVPDHPRLRDWRARGRAFGPAPKGGAMPEDFAAEVVRFVRPRIDCTKDDSALVSSRFAFGRMGSKLEAGFELVFRQMLPEGGTPGVSPNEEPHR